MFINNGGQLVNGVKGRGTNSYYELAGDASYDLYCKSRNQVGREKFIGMRANAQNKILGRSFRIALKLARLEGRA